MKKMETKGNSIELSSIIDVRLGSKYASVNITLQGFT